MSQNIALLIGNTKYEGMSTLECCINDVAQVRALLTGTQKFGQIIDFIDEPVSSVKDKIRKLAEGSDECQEVFFYFTGHGISNSNDFFMCFKDFKETSPNTSGLSRKDAFELLRLFEADLSVVVIDACEAGRNLIKSDAPPLAQSLKTGFSNFVQIASCTETQFSIAGDDISAFTDEFIQACLHKPEGPVYYSDVESALRDAFLNNSDQTPHFIRQGTSQERFCEDADRLSDFRSVYLNASLVSLAEGTEGQPTTNSFAAAKAAIEKIEKGVPTKDEAQAFIDDVIEATLELANLSPEVSDLFESRVVKYNDFENVQNKQSVINLLNRRGGSDRFVESTVERIKRQQPFGGLSTSVFASLAMRDEYDKTYDIENRCNLKSVHVGLYFEPQFMALARPFSEIVFLPRLTECLILTSNSKELRTGWDSFQEFEGSKSWDWSSHSWSDDPAQTATKYVADPINFVRDYILSFNDSKE